MECQKGVIKIKFKDRIYLGAISGLIAGTPSKLMNYFSYKKGLTDFEYVHIAFAYLLSRTGRDKAMFKGFGVGALAFVFIYGLTSKLKEFPQSEKPLAHLLSFLDHVTFGSFCGLLVSKLGDDLLFSKTQSKK
ncbi:hypothetical protein [Natranaerobius trueperi]|uniref:hypothetical protein n=1 Tax=Natranaerobius trueperi TaxID=759412 RepID=UPI00117E1FE0|nr:hypothetical protein [Natranaerobius trueperi]